MFDNVDKALHLTGPESDDTRAMTDAMAGAWLAFAHKSDPNHKGLPHWRTYNKASREVMLFETPPKVISDPFREERQFMDRYQPVRATAQRD
jgi:para-nitrobenzyl esterase